MSNSFDKLKSSISDLIFEEDVEDKKVVAEPQPQKQEYKNKDGIEDFVQEKLHKETNERENIILQEEAPMAPVVEIKPMETSVITEGTHITGNIRTESNVKVEGKVEGNIDTTAQVTVVGGEVAGDIKANMIGTKVATVKGNITSNDIVEILEESYVEGNIVGDKIYIAGRVMGNINSGEMLTLSSEAVVEGDILTKKLRIEDGSIINGRITMSRSE